MGEPALNTKTQGDIYFTHAEHMESPIRQSGEAWSR